MKLIKGQFIDDNGAVVPAEFGNLEQIKLLKRAEEFKDGFVVYLETEEIPTYENEISFKCVCDKNISRTIEDGEEIPDPEIFIRRIGKEISCRHCKATYTLEDNKDGDILVKLK